MALLVTGGAGFIGANFVLDWFNENQEPIINLDKLTYAGNYENLLFVADDPRHTFVRGDIEDGKLVGQLFEKYQPRAVVHFAAESHVDRSIYGPEEFIRTNIVGTFRLLQAAREYWMRLSSHAQDTFRFLHISTDEVYGTLSACDPAFRETNRYEPNSPYSATKAASDHLVRAYHHTYGLPVLTANCSNNYGPFQFPEKLIPLMILQAIAGKPLPVYGDGLHVRDWLFVKDHCTALRRLLQGGKPGESYNIGGLSERTNLDVVSTICDILDELRPRADCQKFKSQIVFVNDRPGHDRRYAMDISKVRHEVGWTPSESFETGIRRTVAWYLENEQWVQNVMSDTYKNWLQKHYV